MPFCTKSLKSGIHSQMVWSSPVFVYSRSQESTEPVLVFENEASMSMSSSLYPRSWCDQQCAKGKAVLTLKSQADSKYDGTNR